MNPADSRIIGPESVTQKYVLQPTMTIELKTCFTDFLAEMISNIYATFLTSERHTTRSESLHYYGTPELFPSKELVNIFKINLKKEIDSELKKNNVVKLDTDYGPTTLLRQALEASNVCNITFQSHKLFPVKTKTQLRVRDEEIVFRSDVIDSDTITTFSTFWKYLNTISNPVASHRDSPAAPPRVSALTSLAIAPASQEKKAPPEKTEKKRE